ncbi:MAG: hypothetical protein M3O02_05695, partial [Acidobacteriota bacterium]|nr:hypothetical protein [Acidobacteriota bacterium]
MQYPSPTFGRLTPLLLCGLLAVPAATPAWAARDSQPVQRILINPLGYLTPVPEFLALGSAMATVHYADPAHLLVTFGVHRLMKRDAEDPPEDADRTIGAFLVELPSGKVVSRAEWRLHDRAQYLWELGAGRFLLRIHDSLFLIDPGHTADPDTRLDPLPGLHFDRRIVSINVSAEHDLLTVQTTERGPAVVLADGPQTTPAPVLISFYRILHTAGTHPFEAAGMVRAPAPLALPAHSGGFLEALEADHSRFSFRFNSGAGTPTSLSDWDTTCYPRSTFVSRSEFVAFGCRGGTERQAMAGFNLNGEFMWQQGFYEPHVNPSFVFAPAAGRFALGRILVTPGSETVADLTPGQITAQEIRVYQTYNGRILFHTTCTPPMRSGQNFALSPDGLHLALIRETPVLHKATPLEPAYTAHEAAVEIYNLPGLSRQDQAAVDQARKAAPPDSGSGITAALRAAADRAAARAVTSAPA